MIPAINPLVLNLRESATLAINSKALSLRKEGKKIYHFGFGQSPFPVPENIQEALRRNTDKKDYLPTQGLPELLEAVSNFYRNKFGYDFSPKNICVGPGSKELIFQIIYLMEGPLLIPAPSWVSYGAQAALRGKEVVPIITKRENGYRLLTSELDRVMHKHSKKQKLLILNNPNNPTGAVYTKEEYKEIAEICRAYQVIVISDEIYAMIDFTNRPHSSLANYYPEGTIVSGGLSKSFAAGGYRLETFSSVSAPIQYAALEAYGNFESVYPFIKKTSKIYQIATGYMYKRFIKMGLHCSKAEGSFYLFPSFEGFREGIRKKGILTGIQLCNHLLEKFNIAVLPASDFYLPATNLSVRVAVVDFDGKKVLNSLSNLNDVSEEMMEKYFPNLVGCCDSLECFIKSL